jgi:hypothetical protein
VAWQPYICIFLTMGIAVVPGGELMPPKCNGLLLTMVTQLKGLCPLHDSIGFFFPGTYPGTLLCSTALLVLHGFQSFEDGLDHLLLIYALHIDLDLAVSLHSFPFYGIKHLHSDPTCQQQHMCLQAAHMLTHFQGPIQALV